MWVLKATWRPPAAGWDGEAEPGQAQLLGLLSHLFHVLRCHLTCHLKKKDSVPRTKPFEKSLLGN